MSIGCACHNVSVKGWVVENSCISSQYAPPSQMLN